MIYSPEVPSGCSPECLIISESRPTEDRKEIYSCISLTISFTNWQWSIDVNSEVGPTGVLRSTGTQNLLLLYYCITSITVLLLLLYYCIKSITVLLY